MFFRKDNFLTIALLMKSFIDVGSVPMILYLIEEVPKFKGFIIGCIAKEDKAFRKTYKNTIK